LAHEREAAIRSAIARLPDRQRRVVSALMEVEDDPAGSYAQAAASLDMPIGSLGPTWGRAVRRLRRDPQLFHLRAAP
jgi:DNA-directed RNA polymerase specialized sigma24 family protein